MITRNGSNNFLLKFETNEKTSGANKANRKVVKIVSELPNWSRRSTAITAPNEEPNKFKNVIVGMLLFFPDMEKYL